MKKLFNSYTNKDWLLALLRITLGGLFIFSGIVKLIPIEPFELKFIEIGVANWTIAPYMARFVIAGELFLGGLLIFNIKPRFAVISTLAVLIFFTLYLIYDIIKNGNDGNCGCFGTFIVMTPLESIVKNVLMIPLAVIVLLLNKRAFSIKPILFLSLIALISFVTPYILYPPDSMDSHVEANSDKADYPFPIEKMPDFNIKGTKIDLTKGEHIVAFLSVTCTHCKKAAYKLHILNQQHKLPPIYFVLLGAEEDVPKFNNETKANFPYYIFYDDNFFKIAGNSIPKVFYLKDGIVKAKFDALTLTEESLLQTIQTP